MHVLPTAYQQRHFELYWIGRASIALSVSHLHRATTIGKGGRAVLGHHNYLIFAKYAQEMEICFMMLSHIALAIDQCMHSIVISNGNICD